MFTLGINLKWFASLINKKVHIGHPFQLEREAPTALNTIADSDGRFYLLQKGRLGSNLVPPLELFPRAYPE
jgi:hypothetical protein